MSYNTDWRLHPKPQRKIVTLFDKEQYDGEWPPAGLSGAIAWFQSMLDQVPEKFRDTAMVEFSSTAGYEGSHYARIEIQYERHETAEEVATRVSDETTRRVTQDANDRATYEALKAKFGTHP